MQGELAALLTGGSPGFNAKPVEPIRAGVSLRAPCGQ